MEQYQINAKNIFKKYFLSESCKSKHKKERLEKPKKEKLLLLIPENIGDRKLDVSTTIKITSEYK